MEEILLNDNSANFRKLLEKNSINNISKSNFSEYSSPENTIILPKRLFSISHKSSPTKLFGGWYG